VSRETLTGSYGHRSSAVRGLQGPHSRVGLIGGLPDHPAAGIAFPTLSYSPWDTSRTRTAVEWPLAEPVRAQHTGAHHNVARTLSPLRSMIRQGGMVRREMWGGGTSLPASSAFSFARAAKERTESQQLWPRVAKPISAVKNIVIV